MDIIDYKKIWLSIAAFIVVTSTVIIALVGVRLGIDFTGGALTEVAFSAAPEQVAVEDVLTQLELTGFSVRESLDEAGRPAFLVRTADLSESERMQLHIALTRLGGGAEITRFTSIGPVIGQELRDKAIWALAAVAGIIIVYVAYAFMRIGTPVRSGVYGGIAILVLIHDLLVPTALMALLGLWLGAEANVLFIMALLAILGYSVNDTIVVFDRVREQLMDNRHVEEEQAEGEAGLIKKTTTYTLFKPFSELVNTAVNETFTRSINTSLTTAAALGALYFIGGDVTETFALVLLAGVIAGTYSSIFIASPLLVAYAQWRGIDVDANNLRDVRETTTSI